MSYTSNTIESLLRLIQQQSHSQELTKQQQSISPLGFMRQQLLHRLDIKQSISSKFWKSPMQAAYLENNFKTYQKSTTTEFETLTHPWKQNQYLHKHH